MEGAAEGEANSLLASPLPPSIIEDGDEQDQACALSIADDADDEEAAHPAMASHPAAVPAVTPVVPESVVSAAEGLSSLIQTSPAPSTPSKSFVSKRKRKEATPVKGRHVPRRKVRREQAAVTVKDHKIPLDEAAGASLYKLTRLWMDDGTQSINHPDYIPPPPPNGGLTLPPPEPHNAQSSAKRPVRPPCQSSEEFDRLIAGDADTTAEAAAITTEQLKETYVHYAKVLRTWFCVQRGHRLRRYTERWKLLASVAARPPAQQ